MRRFPAFLLVVLAACTSTVAPTNPYDPATPPEQQAKATLRGALVLSGAASSSGVTLWLRENGRLLRNVTSAVDGAFLFDALVPGSYALEAAPAGFAPVSLAVALRAGEDVDVGTVSLVALASSSAIEGVATLAGVDPVDQGGTLVEAVGRAYTAVTNSTGEYRLDVPAGDYDLRFSHASFVTVAYSQRVTVTAGQTRALDPVLLPTNPATLVGHVEGELPDGGTGPLGDATVSLEGTQLSTLTLTAPAARGDFTLPGIPAGSYVVRVLADGYLPLDVPVFDLVGGKVRALPESIVLSLARGGLAGAVTLSDSSDASGVVVEVAGTSRAVVTGSDGTFRLDGLLAGTWSLSARRDGYARKDLGTWPVRADQVTAVTPAVLSRQGGSVSVVEGAWVAAPGIHLAVVSGAGWYKASEDAAFADAPAWLPVPAGGPLPFTLADADGEHVVWVAFSADGVTAGTPASVPVVLDRQAPSSPTVVIGGGSGFTAAPGGIVSLSLSAFDLPAVAGAAASGLERMELSNDGAFAAPVRLPYALSTTWTLAAPAQDGPKTVWARFVDRAGNVSAPASTTVVLDTAPPASPSIALAGPPPSPPGTTTSPFVTVVLSAVDANAGPAGSLLQVRLAGTPGFDGARWQPFASALTWLLPPGDGPKTVWAQFMDPAGNESLPVSDAVVLDTTGPSSPAVVLTEQDSRPTNAFTNRLTVDLSLSAQGGATAAKISEDPSFTAGVKVVAMGGSPTATTFTFGGSGLRTAWVRFEDAAGNVSAVAAASVTVDSTPPAPVAPALVPATITTGTAVQLVPPSAGQDEVQLAGSLSSPGPAAWTAAPAGVPIPVILTTGDGPKSIVATWRDLADNVTVAPAVSIALDQAAPTAVGFAVAGTLGDGTPSATLAASTGVTLDFSAVVTDGASGSGVAEMQVSNLPSLADASWVPFIASGAVPWTLPPGDGPRTVYARFRDRALNGSAIVTGAITLRETPPSGGTVSVEGGAAATSKASAALAISAVGATELQVVVSGTAGAWMPYGTTGSAPLADPEGTKLVAVKFRNAARVEGGSASSAIVYDHTAPPAPAVVVRGTLGNGGTSTVYASSNAVVVDVSATSDAVELALVQSATCTFPASPTWLPLSGASTFLLTGGDGVKTVCAKLRDRAGNVGPAGQASITLDTAPPSNPAFADLTTLTTNQAGVTGTLVASSVDPAPGTGVTYQCYSSPASPTWTDCTPSGGNQVAFSLTANGPNVVGVRARDAAFNASTGTLVSVLQDSVKPFPPNVTQVRTTRDSLTLTWDPSADKDLAYFLVYYGGAAGDVSGTGAAQGPSPVQVAALGTGVQSYTLTGLTAGVPYYVAVEAIDRAGNRSGLSGQRSAVPNKVNPRVLSGVGGQPRSLATLTDAVSGRTFAYLAENQGVVQLDVSSEIASPRPIGRAFVSNVVPDTNAPPAVIPCTRGGAAGHCVILAGSTLEGDFRGDPDDYRAPAPVVYFPLTGTAADPALGEVETVLPALPHRVLAGAVGAQTVVFAVERGRIVAFDLSRTSFPVQLAEAALPTPLASVLAATLVGSELWVYGPWWANGISHEPTLEYVDVTDAPYGDMYPEDHGPLNDQLGRPLGSLTGYDDPHPLPAFGGGIYVLYTDFWSNGYVCGYDGWAPDPETCATFPMDTGDDGDQLVAAAAGNGHVYAFVRWGNSQGPYAYQFNVVGGSVSAAGTASSGLPVSSAAEAAFVGAYASSPVSTPEHLLAIDRDEATGAYTLQRFRVSGPSLTVDSNSWREISPTFFAESDRFLFVSQGMNLDAVDVSNPLVPRPLAPTNRDANDVYGKLVVHGSLLFALAQNAVAGPGVEIFRIGGDGALTFVSRVGTTSTPHDLAVVGKWLLVGRATGIAAWSIADPAVPVAAGSIVTTPFEIRALDARPATSGSAWTAVVYAAVDGTWPGVVRTYGYAWNSVTPSSSTFTALSGAVALPPSNSRVQGIRVRGTTAAVSDANGTVLLSVASPASPGVVTSLGGVTGPVLLQGGYVVGLAPSVSPSGPLFDVYTGQAATSGAVDGSLFYSTCGDDGAGGGSLVHSTGVYAASCRRNGITLFTAGDPGGGRLLKKFDVTDLWWPSSAALATDGLATTIGGAWAATPSSDWNRLWWADELQNAGGSPTAPTWSGALASKTVNFLAHNDGLTWAVADGGYATGPTLQAFEAANPAGAARVTFATAGGEATTAQPVANGDFLFLPRSASGVGSASRVEAYDVRDPAAFGAPPASVSVVTSQAIGAVALSRAKLYVGEQPVQFGAAGTNVHVFTVGATTSGGRSIPTFTRVTPIALGAGVQAVTGIAASGRWLFVTVQDATPNAWELVVLKLDPATRDGAGATVVARYPSSLPLANPVVSGDVLYASNNLGVASWDLGPLWRSGAPPSFLGGTANADPTRAGPVRFLVDGPFGYLAGGTYRAFDLR